MVRIAEIWTSEGAKFAAYYRALDASDTGLQWPSRADVAQVVVRCWLAGQRMGFYEIGSWVVMPNHIHALLCPLRDLSSVVSGIKVASAKEANRLLGRTGPFWSRDYFDRWMRNSAEEKRVIRYIENNPVRAGLCREAEDWPYSSATARRTERA